MEPTHPRQDRVPAPQNPTSQRRPLKEWNRQPGETALAYRAFCLYRDLGPSRSLRRASALGRQRNSPATPTAPDRRQPGDQQETKQASVPGCWSLWSARFSWYARAQAFDDYIQSPEYQLERKRVERRTYAQAAYDDIVTRLMEKLKAELPRLPFTTQTATAENGSTIVTHGTSPASLAAFIRELANASAPSNKASRTTTVPLAENIPPSPMTPRHRKLT